MNNNEKKKKQKILITITVIASLVLLGGGGICLVAQKQKNPLRENQGGENEEEQVEKIQNLLDETKKWVSETSNKINEIIKSDNYSDGIAEKFTNTLQNLIDNQIRKKWERMFELRNEITNWKKSGEKLSPPTRKLFKEIQSGLATELPTEPSLLSVIEEIENVEKEWKNIVGSLTEKGTKKNEIKWDKIKELSSSKYKLEEDYWNYWENSRKGRGQKKRTLAAYILQRELWELILEPLEKKGEEHWENILLKSMKERVNFLQKQETNFSYVNEEERETNFPFNQLLTTLLQQEIYLFLINNAYQQDNDPLVKSESENILAELSEYRTLKDEASPGEVKKLLAATWKLLYFSCQMPQKINDDPVKWKFFAGGEFWNGERMKHEGYISDEDFGEKVVFCYFPWIGHELDGGEYKTVVPAKAINDKGWEEICEEKQEAEKITFEVYIEIYFCPSLHPPNISDYIRFCRNFALRKGALVSDIKAKDFFFIHRNHPTLIDKPLYYGIKDDYNYTLSLYKNEVEKQVFEVGDFVELELVEFNN